MQKTVTEMVLHLPECENSMKYFLAAVLRGIPVFIA